MKTVLHVGCGSRDPGKVHPIFRGSEWQELRLDIDPRVEPDVVASITAMTNVADASVDGVWSSHNLEHLYAHEVPIALAEFLRVLKPGGLALVTLPDLQAIAAAVTSDGLEETLYVSPAGPICPIDVLFGYRPAIRNGNSFMAHKTGFTATTLRRKLEAAGFAGVHVEPDAAFNLWAVARKFASNS